MRMWIAALLLLPVLAACGDKKTTTGTGSGDGLMPLANTAPTAPRVRIEPRMAVSDGPIWVELERPAEDLDGDTLTYRYRWFRDGEPQGFADDATAIATDRTGYGDVWRVEVHAFDGTVTGPAASAERWLQLAARTISLGENHGCRVRSDGRLLCWGANAQGQLGHAGSGSEPAAIDESDAWVSVGAGAAHTCAVRDDGALYCWGANGQDQLTSVAANPQPVPFAVDAPEGDAPGWRFVVAGRDHSCGIKTDRTLWCWGDNVSGQLGENHVIESRKPIRVGIGTNWIDLTAGDFHTCGIRSDNSLWCWGDDADGQIGTADEDTSYPRLIGADKRWISVAAGKRHTCATTVGGELWCWGANDARQLGVEGTHTVPVRVGAAVDWSRVSAGGAHSCGLKYNRTLWCWGSNGAGQLGSGLPGSVAAPVQVSDRYDWSAVQAGGDQTCAMRLGGELWCWGRGAF